MLRSIYAAADAVVVHSEYARARVLRELGPHPRVLVARHGNYIDAYPQDVRPREEIRRLLGIAPRAYTYLLFGQVARYKRVPEAIRAFRRAATDDARLLVVGRMVDRNATLAGEIATAREGDPRVEVRYGAVHANEVAFYHQAADAAVLPYQELLSSGALLLALSFGLPVIVPADGSASEIASPPAIEPFDDLSTAFASIRTGRQRARRKAAKRAAEACSWDEMASVLAEAYAGGQY